MDSLIKVIKVFVNTLMTLILIIGILFIFLYVIGIEPFVVESGSMEPSIHVGSLCFINKHYDYEKINENHQLDSFRCHGLLGLTCFCVCKRDQQGRHHDRKVHLQRKHCECG